MCIWTWLVENSNPLLAILTAAYVVVTGILVAQNAKVVANLYRSDVSLQVVMDDVYPDILYFEAANRGTAPALEVRFEFKAQPVNQELRRICEVGFIKRGIPMLAPGQVFRSLLTNLIGNLEELKKDPLMLEATFFDAKGKKKRSQLHVDFGGFENMTWIGKPSVQRIAESLEKLQQHASAAVSSSKRFTVVSLTPEDVQTENRYTKTYSNFLALSAEQKKTVTAQIEAFLNPTERDPGTPA